jgi:perosamine synthetase
MIPIAKPVLGKEEISAVSKVIKSGAITQGKLTEEFEKRFASFIGTKHGIACSSGTSALQVGLEALGIKPGDEVITTPFTFIATANAIVYNRATPVFADVDEKTFNIDVGSIKSKITRKTKAVMVVHLYGQTCDMKPIKELCSDKGLLLIEDAAQAHGAEYKGRKAGSFGNLSAFSFYATKNMTCGEGGMIMTDDDAAAQKSRIIINQGQMGKYEHVMVGYNYRMTDMQAAMGLCQLRKLGWMNAKRDGNARYLTRNLSGLDWLEVPYVMPGAKHVWHQYTVKVSGGVRDDFMKYLNDNEVGARIYYPMPVHLQPAYQQMGYRRGICPVAESLAGRVLSLPVHPLLKKSELKKIVEVVKNYRRGA